MFQHHVLYSRYPFRSIALPGAPPVLDLLGVLVPTTAPAIHFFIYTNPFSNAQSSWYATTSVPPRDSRPTFVACPISLGFCSSSHNKSRHETVIKKGKLREKTHFHPPHPVLFPLPTVVRCGTNCHTVPRRPILLRPTSVPSLVSMLCRPNFWFVALTSNMSFAQMSLVLDATCLVFLNFRLKLPPSNRRTGPPSHRFDPFPQLFSRFTLFSSCFLLLSLCSQITKIIQFFLHIGRSIS